MPATIGRCRYEYESRGQLIPLAAFRGLSEPPLGDQGHHVEVGPPERGRERDAQDRGGENRGGQVELRTDAERHDGLAEGEDDDEAVALREVRGDESPAFDAEHRRSAEVQDHRHDPQHVLGRAADDGPDHQETDRDRRAHGERDDGVVERLVVATGEEVQHQLCGPDAAVRDREGEGPVAEGLREAQRHDQQSGAGREHHEADRTLLGVDQAGQPGVTGPRPPQERQGEQAASEPGGGRVRHHQRRALGEPEHEDEVEEELERFDRLRSWASMVMPGRSGRSRRRRGAIAAAPYGVTRRAAMRSSIMVITPRGGAVGSSLGS